MGFCYGLMGIFVKLPETGCVPDGPIKFPEKFPDSLLFVLAIIVNVPLVPP